MAKPERCAAQHFGPWMVYPQWFAQALSAVKAGTFKPMQASEDMPVTDEEGYATSDGGDGTLLAIIPIVGQMTKAGSSYGGASTVEVRKALRKAVGDDSVSAILLHIDSPGGTVAGTGDLAAEVAEADKRKPVYTYFEDLGASAAYWVGSQSRRVFANPTAEIGSIGTMTYVEDTSGAYEKAGIKVTLIATGPYKGQWVDGNPVSDEYIDAVRTEVEDLNEHFLAGVMSGRNLSRERLMESADGRVFIASKALQLGLIDEVASFDVAVKAISREVFKMNSEQFRTFAAEHPDDDAVKSIRSAGIKHGEKTGTDAERARVVGILEAHGLKSHAACTSIVAGHDPETAKCIADAASAEKVAAQAALDAKDAEIARLKALAETGGHPGVGGGATDKKNADKPDGSDPKALAEWEWDNKQTTWNASTKDRYVASRTAELSGQLRIAAAR